MVFIQAEDYRFLYPGEEKPALDISGLEIGKGTFCLVAGASGSGKTTLLRQLSGSTVLQGKEQGSLINNAVLPAYVWQDPAAQIVTDRAEYEIVFGLENMGMPKEKMQRRLAEVVTFFGLEEMAGRDTMSLSGGEMQTLNAAAAVAQNPDLLLLDEPTSQLDPVASRHFYEFLRQVNEELGITIIITEQRLEDVVPLADEMILMEDGRICTSGRPEEVFRQLSGGLLSFFPSYMQLFHRMEKSAEVPLTKKEARKWFCSSFRAKEPDGPGAGEHTDSLNLITGNPIIGKNLFFRYEKSLQRKGDLSGGRKWQWKDDSFGNSVWTIPRISRKAEKCTRSTYLSTTAAGISFPERHGRRVLLWEGADERAVILFWTGGITGASSRRSQRGRITETWFVSCAGTGDGALSSG